VTPEQGAAAPAASGDGTPLYFTPGEAAAIVRVVRTKLQLLESVIIFGP